MRVTLLDYGAGNLHSLAKAVAQPGVEVRITTEVGAALDSDALLLPGVGAFGAAAEFLASGRTELRRALDGGLPCIGICLGMQLLFDASDEGEGAGLGVFPGRVTRLRGERVPHIGWNQTEPTADDPALAWAYYAHSFACRASDASIVRAWTTHEGDRFPAAVRRGRVAGVQFHPEKSGSAGVRHLRALLTEVTR